jgi:hypothetical protein
MKTTLATLSALVLAVPAWSTVIAGWNFNDTTSTATQQIVSTGSGTLTISGLNIDSGFMPGTLLNAVPLDVAGNSLAVLNDATGYLQFEVDLSAVSGVTFSFAAVNDDSEDQNDITSIDVSGFSDFSVFDNLSGQLDLVRSKNFDGSSGEIPTLANAVFSFNIPAAYEGDSSVFVRMAIGDLDGTNTRELLIDNVVIAAVPEPSTYALLAGFLALGLVMIRRRASR